mmetsp:Transcript_8845/g.19169  ORF Transcript_8845/g.19169 Transcript_8845/m.19169 type:complete len:145 (-) Transcript_8845:156-590(-)
MFNQENSFDFFGELASVVFLFHVTRRLAVFAKLRGERFHRKKCVAMHICEALDMSVSTVVRQEGDPTVPGPVAHADDDDIHNDSHDVAHSHRGNGTGAGNGEMQLWTTASDTSRAPPDVWAMASDKFEPSLPDVHRDYDDAVIC